MLLPCEMLQLLLAQSRQRMRWYGCQARFVTRVSSLLQKALLNIPPVRWEPEDPYMTYVHVSEWTYIFKFLFHDMKPDRTRLLYAVSTTDPRDGSELRRELWIGEHTVLLPLPMRYIGSENGGERRFLEIHDYTNWPRYS